MPGTRCCLPDSSSVSAPSRRTALRWRSAPDRPRRSTARTTEDEHLAGSAARPRCTLTQETTQSFQSRNWARARSAHARFTPDECEAFVRLRSQRRSVLARQAPRDDLRDAVLGRRDAVEHVRCLHRPLLVRDDDELRAVRIAAEQLDEAADVRVVERGLHLVEQVEGARPCEEEREQERDRTE